VQLCQDALRAVLLKARSLSPAVWIASLEEIANWYRALGEAFVEAQPQIGGGLQVCVHAPQGAMILARGIDIHEPVKPWSDGYNQVLTAEFTLRGEARPWIGLPPDPPRELYTFLRHLGYLIEVSPNQTEFSYYFSYKSFSLAHERPILQLLEGSQQPLVRFGRWPAGAKAALAVTGDVDAFTLWDYGLRMFNR